MEYIDKEQEDVKKTFAGEKNKLSKMTFGEKVDYIFTYYKLHILAVLLVIGAITWGIHHAATYVQYRFYGMVINSGEFNESREQEIHDYLGMGKHDGFSLTGDLFTDEMSSGGYGNRLTIFVMAGQMDFAFTDQTGVDFLNDMGAAYEVRDISDSPIHEYFGLDDNTKYLVLGNLSGEEEYMNSFCEMLDKIEKGEIK